MAEYNPEERTILLKIARDSIRYGIEQNKLINLNLQEYPEHLQQQRACFVTLHLHGKLRGCIGSLQASQALILDVACNAFNAAFNDPRFSHVTAKEFKEIMLDISVLSQPVPLSVTSEADLISKLRPGLDGLILSDQGHRATFLPSVWAQIPTAPEFVMHLKNKAGWASNYWSNDIHIETYTAELIVQ